MPKVTPQHDRFAKEFGTRLKAILKNKGKSQVWLAETTGLSTGSVGNWCQGLNPPSLENAMQIADALGESLDFLTGARLPGKDSQGVLAYRLGQRLGRETLSLLSHVPDARLKAALAVLIGELAIERGGLPSEPAPNHTRHKRR